MNLYMESKEITSDLNEEMLNRREVLTKAGCLTLSAATMMILIKSQPAKGASTNGTGVVNQSTMAKPTDETWVRTVR